MRRELAHVVVMDDAEIKRLRREIHRSYGSSPHKKKVWLALLEIYGEIEKNANQGGRRAVCESRDPAYVARHSIDVES